MQIPAGEYEYPFRFELPSSIPSSFVGEYGRIAYCIKGVVDRPWRFDHETVSFFTVIGVYDLNSDSSAAVSNSVRLTALFSISIVETNDQGRPKDVWLFVLRVRASIGNGQAGSVRLCPWGDNLSQCNGRQPIVSR